MRTTVFSVAVAATLAVGALAAPAAVAGTLAAPAPADSPTPGAYTAVTPSRVLDTRIGTGGPTAPLTVGVTRTLQLAGQGGLPNSGASAVVLNVTVTNPTTPGNLAIYPSGGSPATSNLNFVAGQTIANLVTVPVSSTGTVTLFLGGPSGGRADVIADVTGWYAGGGTPRADGAFVPVTPARLLDTRGSGGVSPAADRVLPVAGRGGVPGTAGAVILNVTVTNATSAGFVTVYPGGTRSATSNLNFVPGQTVPNLVAVPLADDGSVSLQVGSTAPADLIVDVFGYFVGDTPSQANMFGALTPVRILDTRSAVGAPQQRVAAQATLKLQVLGHGGVPTSGVSAVVVTVTAVYPDRVGLLTAFGSGSGSSTSTLNYTAGSVVPNLAIVPVASDGTISIYNGSQGSTDVLADVSGYVRSGSLAVPSASVSRYVNDLTGSQTTFQIGAATKADATQDAAATSGGGPRLVILEFGAQSSRAGGNGTGGGSQTGVSLPAVPSPGMRLTYAQVDAAVQGYLDGYAAAAPGVAVTVAVGTNSAGYLGSPYAPTAKGADWAARVKAAAAYAATKNYSSVTVVGANDIEAGFSATADEVRAWITAYRGVSGPPALINNGAAAACPTTLGTTNQTCGAVYVEESDAGDPVYNTWAQSDYVSFSAGSGISIAPQVYVSSQAPQWENILLSSGGGSIRIAGVMTQVKACTQVSEPCQSLTPTQAWAAMNQALDAYPATASVVVPTVTDIRYP